MMVPASQPHADATVLCHVSLFGTLHVVDPGGVRPPITRFRTQRSAALLAFLAFHPGQHSREMLAEMLWPNIAPDVGRTRLKQEIATLRRHLETDGMVSGSILQADGNAQIGLRSGAVSTDAAVFEDLLRQADAPGVLAQVAHNLLRQAAALHGESGLLPGRYEVWVSDARERLLLLYAHALQRIAASADPASMEAWDAARRAVQAAPFDEASHAALIRLHLAQGNAAAARAQFAQWKRVAEEQGDDAPSESLSLLINGADTASPSVVVPDRTPGSAHDVPFPLPIAPAPLSARLPPLMTQFFGREKELSAVWDALEGSDKSETPARIVTLTGPGGIGKTRISLEIAHRFAQNTFSHFPTMAAFVPLAGVSDAGLLWDAVLSAVFPHAEAGAAGTSARSHLIRLLEQIRPIGGDGRVLLVLDNFEQIADTGTSLIGGFLHDASFVACLVTSRQRLHAHGEREVPISPLPFPAAFDDESGQQAAPSPTASVLLFADRVRATRPDFTLTPHNTKTVGEICRILDGIPLALELAAARFSVMGLTPLRDSLRQNRLDILVSRERDREDRHRTLRDTIAWSYQLLPPPVQHLFVRLSVFRSGWTIGAARAVSGLSSEADVFPLLETLHDHHLVTSKEHDATSETRFQMLETLRQWGAEQLLRAEQAETNARFVSFYLDLTAVADLEMRGEREKYWLARLDAEHDNLRAALVWAIRDAQTQTRLEGDPLQDAALRLCDEVAQYWWLKGHLNEGRKWYKDAIAASEGFSAPRAVLSDALRSCASLVHNQGDNDEARDLANRALHIAQVIGHRRCEAYAHGTLARIALNCGTFQTARDHLGRGLSLFALYDPKPGYIQNMEAIQRHNLGIALLSLGDPEKARTCFEETMGYWRSHGMVHRSQIADSLEALGELEWLANKPEAALPLLEESLSIRRNMNVKGGLSQILLMLGRVHHVLHAARARPFLRESIVLAHETGDRRGIVEALEAIAASEAAHERWESAARIWGMAAALREHHPTPVPSPDPHGNAQDAARVHAREKLGKEKWEACQSKGRAVVLTTSLKALVDAACDCLDGTD